MVKGCRRFPARRLVLIWISTKSALLWVLSFRLTHALHTIRICPEHLAVHWGLQSMEASGDWLRDVEQFGFFLTPMMALGNCGFRVV